MRKRNWVSINCVQLKLDNAGRCGSNQERIISLIIVKEHTYFKDDLAYEVMSCLIK